MTSRARVLLTAASCAALTACGSTVAGSVSSGHSDISGLGVSAGTAQLAVGQSAASGGTPAAGLNATSRGGAGSVAVNPAGSGGSGATVAAPNGPGVTAKTISIGVSYYQSAEAANAALGAKGLDFGDPVASTRLLVNAINAAGGVAGRKLVPLFYAIDPQSSTPYATEAQTECAYFTEDHKVFALIDGTPAADSRACLDQHGVVDLRGPLMTAALTHNEVDAFAARLDRTFAALVPSLVRQGWFGAWNSVTGSPGTTKAKIGIVTPDSRDDDRAVDGVLIPALRNLGYGPDAADVIRIAEPGGFSDDGATVAAIDNAALKLNTDGVDHVFLVDGNGSLSLLFQNYAYSQNYFPRYGGTSGNAWQVLLAAGDLQAKTLAGAQGIGWQPLFDLPYQQGDGPDSNPARHRCFALFTKAGMAATDDSTAGAQAEGCDVAFLLPAVFASYRGPINLDVFLSRVDALGTTYPLASALGSRLAPDQHDGIGAYSAWAFNSGCSCFGYSGVPQPMPR